MQLRANRWCGHVIVSPIPIAETRTRLLEATALASLLPAPTITHALIDAAIESGLSFTAPIEWLRICDPEIVSVAYEVPPEHEEREARDGVVAQIGE